MSGEDQDRIRVLVVDDRPIFRHGAQSMLSAAGGFDLVGEASNGREAVEMALAHRPDVILMDVEMPEMDGVEATERIVAELEDVAVLALTVSEDHDDVVRMVAAGACGYLLKEAGPGELTGAVRAAAQGRVTLDARMGRAVLQRLGRDASRSLARVEIAEALTPRETQILRLLATGAANKEIAAEIGTSEATVKVHLKSLYAKLGVGSRSAAAAIAVAAGV